VPNNQPVAILRLGPTLHRIDLPCTLLGLAAPPASADLKLTRSGAGWTVLQPCAADQVETFTRWLHGMGAADVQRSPPNQPMALRARFHQLPPLLQRTLGACRVEHLVVSPVGTASFIVRADAADASRVAALLEAGSAAEAPIPVLTHRQAELLQYCVTRGYYSIPRRASLRVLSGELGISTTSLSLALRRAEAKIVLSYVARLPHAVTPSVAAAQLAGGSMGDDAPVPLPHVSRPRESPGRQRTS